MKKLVRNYQKNAGKKDQNNRNSQILSTFWPKDFLTKNTKNCANFVGSLLFLRFFSSFAHLPDFDIPMTELSKYERWAKLLLYWWSSSIPTAKCTYPFQPYSINKKHFFVKRFIYTKSKESILFTCVFFKPNT